MPRKQRLKRHFLACLGETLPKVARRLRVRLWCPNPAADMVQDALQAVFGQVFLSEHFSSPAYTAAK
jgi:hypothetical protein